MILLKFYREIDDDDEGGGDDGEEFEDRERLPPESDSDESENECQTGADPGPPLRGVLKQIIACEARENFWPRPL